jgi:hypothetical protein
MKGVTGGALPAEIWKQFVEAATPIVEGTSRLELTRGNTESSSAPVDDQLQCDQSACAAAYRSFRASDCTYQSYGGSRKLCMKNLSNAEPEWRKEKRRREFAEERAPERPLTKSADAGDAAEEVRLPLRGPTTLRGAGNKSSLPSQDNAGVWMKLFGADVDRP